MRTVFRIEHRLGVPTPAGVAWALLAKPEAWPDWNPMTQKVRGILHIGDRLILTEQVGEERPRESRPTVQDWEPGSQILLRFSERVGLLTRLRYLEIEKLTDEACIFSIGEDWSGPLARFSDRRRRRALRAAFKAAAEALRDNAVALAATGAAQQTTTA